MASITATKEKNLFDVVPEAREYYDFDKNKEIDISTLSVASHTMVWWKCPNCGDENCKTVNSKIKRLADGSFHFYGCKIHNNGKRNKSRTLQKVADTDFLARIWDSANNPNLNPSEIAINSKARANWVCPKCKHEWCASIYRVFDVSGRCPACEGRNVIVPGSTDVLSLVPEAKRYYNWEKNIDIDIEHLGVGSSTEVWWRCPDCGNETKMPIKNKVHKRRDGTYYVRSCNKCFGKWRDKPGKANKSQPKAAIVSENANLMKFWDWDGNKDLDPTSVHIYSRRVVAWKCPKCHYAWTSSVNNLRGSSGECPCCEQRRVIVPGINDIFSLVPEAKQYYDFEKNTDIEIASINISSKRRAWWKCPTCGNETYSSFAAKIKRINESYHFCTCKKCYRGDGSRSEKKTTKNSRDLGANSLAEIHPAVALLWSNSNERSARTVTPNSSFDALWDCPDCNLEYRALVHDMVNGNASCPFCNNRRVRSGYNSLIDKNPNIAKFWSQNNYLHASDVFPTSTFSALWICPNCDGEYSAPVNDMVEGIADCPYCADRRVLPSFNSFAAKHSELLNEWDYIRNYTVGIDPDTIFDTDLKAVWWICKNGHKFRMSTRARLLFEKRHKTACLTCKGRRREIRHFI